MNNHLVNQILEIPASLHPETKALLQHMYNALSETKLKWTTEFSIGKDHKGDPFIEGIKLSSYISNDIQELNFTVEFINTFNNININNHENIYCWITYRKKNSYGRYIPQISRNIYRNINDSSNHIIQILKKELNTNISKIA